MKSIYASLVGAADRIYITSREGVTLVMKNQPKLEVLAINKLPERIDASPAIVGRELFLRGQWHLYKFLARQSRTAEKGAEKGDRSIFDE